MTIDSSIDRREFLRASSAAGLGMAVTGRLGAPAILSTRSPSDQVVVAVMGLNGRGMVHARNFRRLKNTAVAYICDVDANVLAKAGRELQDDAGPAPKELADFRRALEDKSVDAASITTA